MSEAPKKIHRKKAAKREAALARAKAEAPKPTREENLKRALASAFQSSSTATTGGAVTSVDVYGKGSATDRLQFGYAPSITEEAVAYHGRFDTESWIATRRANYQQIFIKKQKLRPANLEPISAVLKLKHHWSKLAQFKSDVRRDGAVNLDAADGLLEMLAAKQRTE